MTDQPSTAQARQPSAPAPSRRGGWAWYPAAAAALGGAVNLFFGVWAFAAPESFYRDIATFAPYNVHFMHDLGAFQLGLGTALVAALFWRDALFTGLLAGAVGTTVHTVSHLIDHEHGGRDSDPWQLGLLAVLLIAALPVRARQLRRRS